MKEIYKLKQNFSSNELISSSMSTKDEVLKFDLNEYANALDGNNMHDLRRPVTCPLPRNMPCKCLLSGIPQTHCPERNAQEFKNNSNVDKTPFIVKSLFSNKNYSKNNVYENKTKIVQNWNTFNKKLDEDINQHCKNVC